MLIALGIFATPALAQQMVTLDQSGAGNHADIDQESQGSSVFVTQAGDQGNVMVLQQADMSTATVIQEAGSSDNVAKITQTGFGESPVAETATQIQSGSGNEAEINQQTDAGHGGSMTEQIQVGNDNFARAWQYSWGGTILQTQIGDGNELYAYQKGTNNSITQTQTGNDNFANVDEQAGFATATNTVLQIQTGDGNRSLVGQYGGDMNRIEVVQVGSDNRAGDGFAAGGMYGVFQEGNGHKAYIQQYGSASFMSATQSGDGNTLLLAQFGGAPNTRFGDFGFYVNQACVRQSGSDNRAEIIQNYQ